MIHATPHQPSTLEWTRIRPHSLSRLFESLVHTEADVAPLALRLTLGLVMFPHGAQKLLGWFGGYGFAGTMGFLTGTAGLPYAVALLVVVAEFFGSLGLITGLLGRVAALGIGAVMTGAILTVHLHNGFFMNWTGKQAGEGFEYHLLAIGLALAIALRGSGAWSIDRLVARKWLG